MLRLRSSRRPESQPSHRNREWWFSKQDVGEDTYCNILGSAPLADRQADNEEKEWAFQSNFSEQKDIQSAEEEFLACHERVKVVIRRSSPPTIDGWVIPSAISAPH